LNKNGFEPEFEPSKDSYFVKITDESKTGLAKYGGFVPLECYDVNLEINRPFPNPITWESFLFFMLLCYY